MDKETYGQNFSFENVQGYDWFWYRLSCHFSICRRTYELASLRIQSFQPHSLVIKFSINGQFLQIFGWFAVNGKFSHLEVEWKILYFTDCEQPLMPRLFYRCDLVLTCSWYKISIYFSLTIKIALLSFIKHTSFPRGVTTTSSLWCK